MFESLTAACVTLFGWINPQVALIVAIFVFFSFVLSRIVNAVENPLQWWHFISTRAADGNQYADIDKLGKIVGIVVSSFIVLLMTHHDKMDAVVLGVYLAFVGGIAGYSAYLRAKSGVPPEDPNKGK
jgi:hypothetical protein